MHFLYCRDLLQNPEWADVLPTPSKRIGTIKDSSSKLNNSIFIKNHLFILDYFHKLLRFALLALFRHIINSLLHHRSHYLRAFATLLVPRFNTLTTV